MPNHYDLTGEPFAGVTEFLNEDGEPVIVLKTEANVREVSNKTFTLRLGTLTPTAAYELWDCVDGDTPAEIAFREDLAQYFFDIYGRDIGDGWDSLFKGDAQ